MISVKLLPMQRVQCKRYSQEMDFEKKMTVLQIKWSVCRNSKSGHTFVEETPVSDSTASCEILFLTEDNSGHL